MSRIVLQGCTPEPLSSYLKSIAILRLFSEQEDPNCKGYWFGSSFVLELNSFGDGLEDLLVQFFLKRYKPTPLVAPWNGGSGRLARGIA